MSTVSLVFSKTRVQADQDFTEHDMLVLLFARSPSRRQQSQEIFHSQMQSAESLIDIDLVLQQSISRNDNSDTHHSTFNQVHHTESALTLIVMFINQSHFFLTNSFLSFNFTSTESQMTLSTENQHQMMIIDTRIDFQQVSVNAHIASNVANEKRKRNAITFDRFRQRRKKKKKKNARNISNLKRRIKELEDESDSLRVKRDLYREKRDLFRNVATRILSQTSILSRSLFSKQKRSAFNTIINYDCIQSKSCDHNESRNIREFSSISY